MDDQHLCHKCGNIMQPGFLTGYIVRDLTGNSAQPVKWIEGAREKRFLSKLFVKLNVEEGNRVMTYRCINCGYLESYAPVHGDLE